MPKVVILDDQATDRQILDRLARNVSADIEVEAFASPLRALDWLAEHQPDLILLDYRLPEMDGIAFLHALQRLPSCTGVPTIMITIVDDIEVRHRALEAGATDFLTKPLDLKECDARFRNLLTLREQRLAIERHAAELAVARQRTNRALRTLSAANTLLSGPVSETELLRGMCRMLVEQAGYPLVRIGLWNDRDELREVACASHADGAGGKPDPWAPGLAEFNADGALDSMRASGEHRVWVEAAPAIADSGHDGVGGFAAVAWFPLRIEGLVDGVLMVFADAADAFDAHEIELLTRTSADLGYGIAARRARTARDRAQRDARYLARFDRLTGLPNQNQALERLREVIGGGDAQAQAEAAVVVIDLDRFKLVNDTAGHDAGDELLLKVVERLRAILRPSDLFARQSSDEFVLVMANHDQSDSITDAAARTASRIIETFSRPFAVSGYEYFIGASIGIRRVTPEDSDPLTIIRQAHTAMHQAKRSGGNTYSCYTGELTDRQTRKLSMEGRLRRALDRSGLQLYFQPIVDLADGRIVALEALVRWPEEDGSVLGPNAFIPLAEEVGLIDRLGHWVFQAGCEHSRAWAQANFTPTMSINLSLQQLLRPQLVEEFAGVVQATGAAPELLQLEITESAMMTDPGRTGPVVNGLIESGMRIALDDFGTGYSSFSRLSRLPITTLKIDKCFIAGVASDPSEQAIVRSMIQLGRGLGLETVGEGIEDATQHQALADMGCLLGQGFHFHRPMPAADLSALVIGEEAAIEDQAGRNRSRGTSH